MKKQYRLTLIVIIVAIGLIAFQLFRPEPTGPDLIKRATKVLDGVQSFGSYRWLTGSELLVITTTSEVKFVTRKRWTGYLDLIDTPKGTRTRLVGLTRVILSDPKNLAYMNPTGFKLSTDGNWLLWNGCAAHMDGSGYHRWSEPAGTGFWMEGSHWVSIFWPHPTMDLIVHDAADPSKERSVSYSSPEGQVLMAKAARDESGFADSLGQVIETCSSDDDLTQQISLRNADSPEGTKGTPVYTVTFPFGSRVNSTPNPQMKSVLFTSFEEPVPKYAALMHRLHSSYNYPAHLIERLSVYSFEKRKYYELGRIGVNSQFDGTLEGVSWLPDGKKIQFEYHKELYTVDVE